MSMLSPEPTMTPNDVLSFWMDTEARVADEVRRLLKLLQERKPGTGKPKYLKGDHFELELGREADDDFMELVAVELREFGWESKIAKGPGPLSGPPKILLLSHPQLALLTVQIPHGI